QLIEGREVAVATSYRLLDSLTFGFDVSGDVRSGEPLIIDPLTLTWGTFLHGSASDDYVISIATDSSGAVYSTGYSQSATFPITPGVYQATHEGSMDIFVTKMNPGGTGLIYSTFIGGSSWEMAYGLEVSESGQTFLAGFTRSSDLPVKNGYQMVAAGGGIDGFAFGLSEAGDSLLFGSYLGGSERDYVYDMKRGPDGSLYLTGFTLSNDFPVTATAVQNSYAGAGDVFVTHLSPQGDSARYSTYFGGSGYELANALALQPDGTLWLVGTTNSGNLSISGNAYQDSLGVVPGHTPQDAYIARLSPAGDSLLYGSYLGGADSDEAQALAFAQNGDLLIGGMTFSSDFPTTLGAYMDGTHPNSGLGDLFLLRFDTTSHSLLYGTYIGGSQNEYCKALLPLDNEQIALLGATKSSDFPLTSGSSSLAGGLDAFLTVFNTQTSLPVQSNLYGGLFNDYPRSPSSMRLLDQQMIVGITTHSPGMPIAGATYQTTKANGADDAPWLGGIDLGVVLNQENLSLDAKLVQEGVELTWPWMESVQRGQIERRKEREEWQMLAPLPLTHHAYLDRSVQAGLTYAYRLRTQGIDGLWSYSKLTSVKVGERASDLQLNIQPNPTQDFLNIKTEGVAENKGWLSILDSKGRLVHQVSLGMGEETRIDVRQWPWGVYGLHWKVPGQGEVYQRVIVE
ncbi:MAG: T9SS type A sorting domain-containing protein, partial [Bacteroidota bacterium]